MRKALIFYFIFLSQCSSAQSNYNIIVDDGLKLLKENQIKLAVEKYQEAWKIDSNRIEANYGLGVAYLFNCENQQNNCVEALYFLNKSMKINENYRNSYYNRGICMMTMKDYKGALADINQAILKKPADTNCYYNRALIEIKLDKKQNACNDLKTALKLGSTSSKKLIQIICK